MAFTLADSLAALESQQSAWDEAVDPGRVVFSLGEFKSSPLRVAVVLKEITTQQDEQGRWRRIQPCIIDVRKELLPSWATAEALTDGGKCITNGHTFKVQAAHDLGLTLHITAFRWPDDA